MESRVHSESGFAPATVNLSSETPSAQILADFARFPMMITVGFTCTGSAAQRLPSFRAPSTIVSPRNLWVI